MATKQIDRLMFAQGSRCFFCENPLGKADASVEHLVASANGGNSHDDNCVACCKAVNALFGSMSLKEKLRVVLNQEGRFVCPNGGPKQPASSTYRASHPDSAKLKAQAPSLDKVVANLVGRGPAKPRRVKTLKSTISALLGKSASAAEVDALVEALDAAGKISIVGTTVKYDL